MDLIHGVLLNMRYFIGIFALFLTACGAPTVMPSGEPVTIQKMLSDTRGRPYECINYDPSSDTCEWLSKVKVRGDRISFDGAMIFPGPNSEVIKLRVNASFKIEGGRYCGNLKNAEIRTEGDLTPAQRSLVEEVFLAQMISMGELCGTYVRDSAGRYTSVTTDRSGRVMQDGVEPVRFFSRPKALRLAV